MHVAYKLIALSIVFGLVLTEPAAKVTPESFDDLAYETTFDEDPKVSEDIKSINEDSRTMGVVVPAPNPISLAFEIVTKLAGLKKKALALAVLAIKWIVPKSLFLIIGAVGVLAFCKFTDKCNLAYDPAVYTYVPAQVKDFVTPERLEDAQQFLFSAMKQYAKENTLSSTNIN